MQKKFVFGCIVLSLFMAAACSDDATEGLTTSCGDGIINNDEKCDGTAFADGVKVCPEGLVLRDESAFVCTASCSVDFTRACAAPTCGDGDLSGAELCDGDKFRNGVKVCPAGMEEVENPVYTCTNTCLIDISQACRVKGTCEECEKCESTCGNGQLDDGEICDGESFADGVKVCPAATTEKETPVFSCTDKCQLDTSAACTPNAPNLCGNGKLDDGEICDGESFANDAKVCPAGTTEKENPVFACTDKCQIDTSAACTPNGLVKCGDGELSGDEVCDGDKFKEDVKACPGDMIELDNPVYACTDTCQIDFSKACVSSICGDGKVTGLEVCDGDQFKEGVKVCGDGLKTAEDRDLFRCNACALDTTYACFAEDKTPTLYISEINMINSEDWRSKVHLYFEIGNLGVETPLSDCKFVGINLDENEEVDKIDPNFVFEYPLGDVAKTLGNSADDIKNVLGICYEPESGWIKEHYDEKTKSVEFCETQLRAVEGARDQCVHACEDSPDSIYTLCTQICKDSAQGLIDQYVIELRKAQFKEIDESCDYYIPATDKSLEIKVDRSGNHASIWGVGVMCGSTMHDMIEIDMLGDRGGSRMCSNELNSIKATGDKVYETYQGGDDAEFYMLINPDKQSSFGYAECGIAVYY